MKYKFEDLAYNITEKGQPTLDDIKNYIGLEHLIPGNMYIEKFGSDVEIVGEKLIMHKGDILFGKRNTYLRRVAIAPCDGFFSAHGMIFRPKTEVIDSTFFPWFIASDYFMDDAISISVGSLSPTLNWKDLKGRCYEIPPLQEQKFLSKKLWAAYEVKQSYFKMIECIEELIKAKFIKMQQDSPERNCLGDFIERCTPKRCGNRDLPVLSVTKEKAIVLQKERFDTLVVSQDRSNYIIVPRGYLVQGIHIDESNFGIQNIVDEGIVSPAYKLWVFKNDDSIPKLIEYYLRSEMAITYFKSKFLGATVQRRQIIKKEDFLAMPLNLPSKIKQEEYYVFFKQANKSITELRKSVNAIEKVIKSILNENL